MRTATAVAGLLLPAAIALANPAHVRVSPTGLEFIEDEIPHVVPSSSPLPNAGFTWDACPGDTYSTLNLTGNYLDRFEILSLELTTPSSGIIRADVTFNAVASGDLDVNNAYLCWGTLDCDAAASIYGARALMNFRIGVRSNGQPLVELSSIDLQATPDDISFDISACSLSEVIEWIVDTGESWFHDTLIGYLEDTAAQEVGPFIEDMLGGFMSYSTTVQGITFTGRVTAASSGAAAVTLDGTATVSSTGIAACVPGDAPEPPVVAGATPNLADGRAAHAAVAVNLGVVNDSLYHAWRKGMLCLSPSALQAFGVSLDLSQVGALFPTLPEGTDFELLGGIRTPPLATTTDATSINLHLDLGGLVADLSAMLPDGTKKTLHIEIDAHAEARVVVNPAVNSLYLDIVEIPIDRLDVTDELGLDQLGFDRDRIAQLLDQEWVPLLIEKLEAVPISGPVFSGVAGYHVILRELRSTTAFLIARIDLFRAPANDTRAPNTGVTSAPSGAVRPVDARVVFEGSDLEVPPELLKFEYKIDGADAGTRFSREVTVGRNGYSGTFRIEARAIDLAGNKDATPAVANVIVDGVAPEAEIEADEAQDPVALTWAMTDDRSLPNAIAPRLKVFQVPADTSASPILVHEEEFLVGVSASWLDLERGAKYRAVLYVTDEVGNEGSDSTTFTVPAPEDPPPPPPEDPDPPQVDDPTGDAWGGGCACRASRGGGAPAGGAASWLLALCALGGVALARRRR